jgi:hypothetical protein
MKTWLVKVMRGGVIETWRCKATDEFEAEEKAERHYDYECVIVQVLLAA